MDGTVYQSREGNQMIDNSLVVFTLIQLLVGPFRMCIYTQLQGIGVLGRALLVFLFIVDDILLTDTDWQGI